MDVLETLLSNEAFIGLVVTVVGGLFAMVKASDWWRARFAWANEELEASATAAVNAVYPLVRELKKKRDNGKLTDQDRRRLMNEAKRELRGLATKKARAVWNRLAELDDREVEALLEEAVRRAKGLIRR